MWFNPKIFQTAGIYRKHPGGRPVRRGVKNNPSPAGASKQTALHLVAVCFIALFILMISSATGETAASGDVLKLGFIKEAPLPESLTLCGEAFPVKGSGRDEAFEIELS